MRKELSILSKTGAQRLIGRDAVPLPRYIEGEHLIIAAILTDRKRVGEVAPLLPDEAFTDPLCRVAYQTLKDTVDLSDSAAFAEINSKSGDLEATLKLTDVLRSVESVNVKGELQRVLETYNTRRLMVFYDEQFKAVISPDTTVTASLEDGVSKLLNIGQADYGDRLVMPSGIIQLREEGLMEREARGRVLTGFNGLDAHLSEGFTPGDLSIIAARPSIGKSAIKQNFIVNLCEQGRGVLNVVPEVGFQKEQDRIDAIRLVEPIKNFYNPDIWDADFKGRQRMSVKYIKENWKYWCQPDPMISFKRTEYDIKRLADQGLDIVFVDLFDRYEEVSGTDNKASVIKDLLNRQKAIAEQNKVHICNIVQLRRMEGNPLAKARKFKPVLEDLRDSGGYEEVSDLVLLLYRPAKYMPEVMDDHIVIMIGKQKTGEADVDIPLSVDWDTLIMEDMDEQSYAQAAYSAGEPDFESASPSPSPTGESGEKRLYDW